MKKYKVQVVEWTGKVVKEILVDGERRAEKVERGLNINLDHNKYFTNIVEDEPLPLNRSGSF